MYTPSTAMRHVTIQDVLSGKLKFPFTCRAAWLSLQGESQDIRRIIAQIRLGTRPPRSLPTYSM